jgi:uncharacterized protein
VSKLLLLILAGFALYLLIKGIGRRSGATVHTVKASEDMVQCAHCGVHLPASEALKSGDELFCSDDHRRLGAC